MMDAVKVAVNDMLMSLSTIWMTLVGDYSHIDHGRVLKHMECFNCEKNI